MQAPTALNAHDLPSVGTLIQYLHVAAGFPLKSTWLAAIKAGTLPAGLVSLTPTHPNFAHPAMKLSKVTYLNCSEYICTITQDWKATYQLVPPDIHRRNLADRAIQTFKAHFLSILAGVSKSFPNYL
ncbi:hypothetical protein ACHAW6_004092 [Cyclotella cf. meneghiniana]